MTEPCGVCGAPCSVEKIDSEYVQATIWICSRSVRLGGSCRAGMAYLTEDAWNDAFAEARGHARSDAERDALVAENERLRRHIENIVYEAEREQGRFVHMKRVVALAARASLAPVAEPGDGG